MENRISIYPNREKEYSRGLMKLEVANITQTNKDLIKSFMSHRLATGRTKQLRAAKLGEQMRIVCLKSQKNLDAMTKLGMEKIISEFNGHSNLSPATQADYRRAIKQFYKWYIKNDLRLESEDLKQRKEAKDLYDFLNDISISYERQEAYPKTIISDEDCENLVQNGCRTPREKALISMLHETGCRAGEFLNIQIGDITIKDNYAEVRVDGKTGPRAIFIVKSLPYLLRWLDVRPNKTEYLWITEATNNKGKPLLHRASQLVVDGCFERAKLNKRHNLHWFRHSRATILAPKITTPMLCKLMGWTLNSRQIKTYCHLSVKDVEDVFLQINGIKPQEEHGDKPIKCICGTLNNQKERYCFKCFKPLKVETIIQDQEIVNSEINKTMQFFMEMAKNSRHLIKKR